MFTDRQMSEYPITKDQIIARGHRLDMYLAVRPIPKPSVEGWQVAKYGKPSEVSGVLVENWLVIDKPLAEAKRSICDEVNTLRDSVCDSGFVFNGHRFDSDESARSNITAGVLGALIAIQSGKSSEIPWGDKDNQIVFLTPQEMVALGVALKEHVSSNIIKAREFKNRVNSADDLEEAIDILMEAREEFAQPEL